MSGDQLANRSRKRRAQYPFNTLNEILGSLLRIPRLQKIEVIEWLRQNHSFFSSKQLRAYYGMMLRLLRESVPVKPMVDLLLELTDENVITQSRVNFVGKLFVDKANSPSLGRLLQRMAMHCGPGIYVPPLGQKQAENSRIPLTVVFKCACRGPNLGAPETIDLPVSKINTQAYQELTAASRSSDAEFADALAQLVPLVQQSGRVLLAMEKCVYEYLKSTWLFEHAGERTQALQVIASALFRFWPRLPADVLTRKLLKPLSQSKKSAAEVLIPHLWHLGDPAASLMDALADCARPKSLEWKTERVCIRYMHIYQFYALIAPAHPPPPTVIADFVVHLKGYLPLCASWSREVPAICATLEGEFSLVSNDAAVAHVDALFGSPDDTDILFSLANSPWLGAYPQRTFSRLKVESGALSNVLISSQRPASSVIRIDEVSLHDIQLSLPQFCEQLVNDLVQEDFDIKPFLLDLDGLGNP